MPFVILSPFSFVIASEAWQSLLPSTEIASAGFASLAMTEEAVINNQSQGT
jgi:hypothetical protein